MKADLTDIPGIGRTFVKDFARIGVVSLSQLRGKDSTKLFGKLVAANAQLGHPTSKNYLYVIRMAIYYADGGREPDKLRWNAWTDAKVAAPKKKAATKAAGKTGKSRAKKA